MSIIFHKCAVANFVVDHMGFQKLGTHKKHVFHYTLTYSNMTRNGIDIIDPSNSFLNYKLIIKK